MRLQQFDQSNPDDNPDLDDDRTLKKEKIDFAANTKILLNVVDKHSPKTHREKQSQKQNMSKGAQK